MAVQLQVKTFVGWTVQKKKKKKKKKEKRGKSWKINTYNILSFISARKKYSFPVEGLRVSKGAFVAAKKSAFASWNQQGVL